MDNALRTARRFPRMGDSLATARLLRAEQRRRGQFVGVALKPCMEFATTPTTIVWLDVKINGLVAVGAYWAGVENIETTRIILYEGLYASCWEARLSDMPTWVITS